jgi:hypothetical protein
VIFRYDFAPVLNDRAASVTIELLSGSERNFYMSSSKAGSLVIDEARQAICREFARCLNAGSFEVRIRMVNSGNHPVAAMFYAHKSKGWQKQPESIDDPELVLALDEALGMLASNHHDDWSAQRRPHTDGYDVDLHFHPEKLKDRMGSHLESALMGLLFRDRHDSKKDSRRSIRTPRRSGSNA